MDDHPRESRGRKRGLAGFQATFGMIIAGPTLMDPAPPRPGQDPAYRRGSGPDEPGQQMAHFRNRQGKQNRHREPSYRAGDVSLRTNPAQVSCRQQHQRHMYVIRNRSEANYSRITYIIRTETEGSIPNNVDTSRSNCGLHSDPGPGLWWLPDPRRVGTWRGAIL